MTGGEHGAKYLRVFILCFVMKPESPHQHVIVRRFHTIPTD
jgi:hypothetical protein